MRILLLFGGRLGTSRGTPSRARNMAIWLARKPGIEVLALSRDTVLELPGLEHRSLDSTSLETALRLYAPDVIYGHTHKALPALAAIGSIPTVVDLHGDPVAEKLEDRSRPLVARLRSAAGLWWSDRRHFRRIDGFTTVSRLLTDEVRDRGGRPRMIWGGVDPDLFEASPGPSGERLVIGYAGNFRAYQGLPTLVDAAASLAQSGVDLRLVLIGDPGRTGIDAVARRALPGRVDIPGQLPYDDVSRALAATNVLVIPRPDSKTARAGFPSKLPEYMALGKALVVTDVGDQARVVEDGRSGLVVAPGSAGELATALETLRSPELRREMGSHARMVAEKSLHWRHMTDDIVEFFEELTLEHRSTKPPN